MVSPPKEDILAPLILEPEGVPGKATKGPPNRVLALVGTIEEQAPAAARPQELSPQGPRCHRLFVPLLDGWVGYPLGHPFFQRPALMEYGAEPVQRVLSGKHGAQLKG